MYRRLICVIAGLLVLMPSTPVQAGVWTVDFDTPHDFLANEVEGTGWDGFIGLGPDETADAINASIDRPGQLYLQSGNGGRWEPNFTPKGPFLYRIVEGDFIATVRVTDFPGMPGSATPLTYWADAFIMARVPNLDDAGSGEDFVCTHYFATWSGNLRRTINNGVESEQGATGDGVNCATYLQLERTGNVFAFRRSFDGVTWTPIGDNNGMITRDDMDGLALQVGLAQCMYIDDTGFVAFDDFRLEGPNVSPPVEAYGPNPANGATDVLRDKVLGWKAAETAVSHDVYLGTTLEDVTAASRTNPLDVLVGREQDATAYDPPSVLTFGQTYYWRVDEVEVDGTIRTGKVWAFTVEPATYPIENITATASSFVPDSGPEKTIGGIGLDTNDQHSDRNADMWLVPAGASGPIWIQYEFDKVYKLYDMWVWNANVQFELYLNFSVKDVTIAYAVDANEWTPLGDSTFEKGTGLPSYTHNTTVHFDGVLAKYVRINVNSNYGGAQTGLSEVRFFQKPGAAREPQPASGATDVGPDVVLSWRAGREAASHQVYLSTDSNAVAEDTALFDTVTVNTCDLPTLDLGTTYYWKIVEVNDAETPISWASDIWSFSTPTYLLVDGFEDYTDDPGEEIFATWKDGYNDNSNGSQVGHDDPPYAEETIVYSGRQSMPLRYGQNGATTSETTMTLPAAQDWTAGSATTLVLYFHGNLGNAAAQLYVKVNNGAPINYPGSPASLAAPLWKQWNIDLTTLGNTAKSVGMLTIGVAGSGTGMLYIDDIRLYREAPPLPEPAVDPGTANLVALYAMEDNVNDGSGNGRNGTAQVGSSFGTGPTGYGKAIVFDGTSGYVDLPIGTLIQSLTSATFATWVNWAGTGGAWSRIFDFGTGIEVNMWLTPNAAGGPRFAITTSGSVGESRLTGQARLPGGGWHHVAVAIDGATSEMQLYVDGAVVASGPTSVLPADLGNTTQNWIGRSQYAEQYGDPYLDGSVDDFRIYNRALSGPEIRCLVGDR